MENKKKTSANSWFESTKASSFLLLLFSFIPSINIAFNFGAYDTIRSSENLEVILFITQGIIGLAFGITFFAPLWAGLPLKTENDFISFRYSGKYLTPLKNTRSILLGVFIIPLLMALVIKNPLEIFKEYGLSNQILYCTVFTFLCLYGLKNSFQQRLKLDFLMGIFFVMACLISIVFLLQSSELSHVKIPINTKSIAKSNIIFAVLIGWWFANIVDFPDMRAQKLLSASSNKTGYFSFLVGNGLIMVIQSVFICLYALFRFHSSTSVEILCLSILIVSCIVQLMNLQHWSGSLMHTFFRKSIANPRIRNFIPMVISIVIAYLICLLTESIFNIIQGILFFTAGVGPVYILRWIYYRVNAITQLTAMFSSLVLGLTYIFLKNYNLFNFSACTIFNLSTTNSAIVLIGLINCIIWGVVMMASQCEEENKLAKERIQQIHVNVQHNLSIKIFQFILTALLLLLLFFGPYLLLIGI